ncbi:MAG: tRNA lysidine(34) synthetase TilS [Anaerolineales bacterium]|jgi:tRNA(Ile)-lysidine synthase|nr:tRNA lysidine(34) synthetase TilS [Anaerolineales bacterium]
MILDCGLKKADLVLVAVSGGADSLALLDCLRESRYPLLVASFNHRLRPEAESDLAHVRRMAEAFGLPFVSDAADVAAYARDKGLSTEEAARELRYRFLFRAARQAGAQAVATGHTADDQAETVLMHFLRGAGLSGLKGMPPRVILPAFDSQIALVRPLLGWTRAETEAHCRQKGLEYRIDSTNRDPAYLRNRLRHELLPQLESYNPQIRQTLAKSALALQGDAELLNSLLDSAWQKSVRAAEARFVAFDLLQLGSLPAALRRNLLRRACFHLQPALRDLDFDALARAATLTPSDLAGGLKTILEQDVLYLTNNEAELPTNLPQIDEVCQVSCDLYALTAIQLGKGWVFTAQVLEIEDCALTTADPFVAQLDADLAAGRLWLRPFRAGDRFQPLGMAGQTVKLSDLFINLKILKRLRKNWPVLAVEDEIAWVGGLRMAERFKIKENTRRVLQLRLKRLP